ncbi:MAG: hypothetical protein LIP02_06520 [Bacteroidales bacterium]|nr:hypothetical protein [Bacteroidales bacterium]
MKTTFFAIILALASLVPSYAYDFSEANSDGVTLYYNILSTSDMTVEVTYASTNYKSYSGDVTIPSTCKYSSNTFTVAAIGVSS